MFKDIKKISKFICVGLSNTVISLLIYYILKYLGMNYLISMAIGYFISSITGYILNKVWVFENKNKKGKSIYRYYALYISALIFNLLLTYFQVDILKISDNIAPLITTAVITVYNYFISNYWVFNSDFNFNLKLLVNKVKENKFYYSAMLITFILVAFLFINNIFNHPVADDYSNYNSLVLFASDNSIDSVGEYIICAVKRTVDIYRTWQGTYFSNIFFSLNPLLISLNFYKFVMMIVQLIWISATIFLFSTLSKNKKNKKIYGLLSMLFVVYPIISFYSLGEGFYWYTGAVLYLLPYALSLVLLGLIVKYLANNSKLLLGIIMILIVLLAGTSYITGLFIGFVLLCITLYMFIYKKKNKKIFLMLTLLFTIAFSFNVLCPGNFNRVTESSESSILNIFLISISNAYEMIKYLLFETLFIPLVIIMVPAIKQISKDWKINYVKPVILVILCSICFVCLFAPMAFSYKNNYQETRVKNIQLLYLAIMIIANYINYYGYKLKTKDKEYKEKNYISMGMILLAVMISAIGTEKISGFILLDDILYNRSAKYDICMDTMINKLEEKSQKVVNVQTCEVYPRSLHHYKMESEGWINDAMSKYYNKIIKVDDYEG